MQPLKAVPKGLMHLPLQFDANYLQEDGKTLKVQQSFPSQHEVLSINSLKTQCSVLSTFIIDFTITVLNRK